MSEAAGTTGLATADAIAERWRAVQERLSATGIDAASVTVVAVTKAFPPPLVGRALDAGLVELGENYAQELQAKAAWLAEGSGADAGSSGAPRWHFVGGLQRNKVRQIAHLVDLWHSVDRPSLATEIAKRAPGARILVQVNTTGEEQKSGCDPADAPALVEGARQAGLAVEGLMTVGPTGGGDPRPSFAALRALADRLELATVSMGMSGDYELAVAEGATMIRLGTTLFGPRPQR
ncbi:MAG: YggS family pyridoxal phosphate-dependent enzyme [Actinomycetota bacterium]